MQQNHKRFYIRSDFFIILNIFILYNHDNHILLLIKMNNKRVFDFRLELGYLCCSIGTPNGKTAIRMPAKRSERKI